MLIEILPADSALGVTARALSGGALAGTFLADYLTSDIQGSSASARDVLAHLDAVEAGREPEWSESGNAFLLTLRPGGALLESHWADEGQPDVTDIPLAEFRAALLAWTTALKQRSAAA